MEHTKILVKCFLLSKRSFGEGHLSLSILTKEHGLIKAAAFGGQRLSRRFKGGLDYFKFIEAELDNKAEQFCITSIKTVLHDFSAISSLIETYAAASYMLELYTIILTPNEPTGKSGINFFMHLYNALSELEQKKSQKDILSIVYDFCITLYTETGFLPDITKMVGTKRIMDHLEEFNSRILGTIPKSFVVLEDIIGQ